MNFFVDFVDFFRSVLFFGPESWSLVVTLTGSLVMVRRGFCWFCHIWPRQMAICRGVFVDLLGFGLLSFILRAFHLWFHSTSLLGALIL